MVLASFDTSILMLRMIMIILRMIILYILYKGRAW
jgi:hypothetical protein